MFFLKSLLFKAFKWILILVVVLVVWQTISGTFRQIYWWMFP
ncbi:MAG TPA: hypothetical protein VMH81_12245 [Bryobacteraceae bacterium]|nr:hypothetical protein [Bryobacteraceae bacterium]